MEYLRVVFVEERNVIINGITDLGYKTGQIIELEAAREHRVSLDGPADFTPPQQAVTLEKTSVLAPKEVYFEKISKGV